MNEVDLNSLDLLAFLNSSPTPFHAVASALERLQKSQIQILSEQDSWSNLSHGSYAMIRGDSTLIAFTIPKQRSIQGFRILGAHTDSPNLRLKPKPEFQRENYLQLAIEVYGGALLNSWLDRDLGIAGRIIIQRSPRVFETKLIQIHQPIARVPQLAIHLDREINERGLLLNKQEHLNPIVGVSHSAIELSTLLELCADSIAIESAHVIAHDLMLYDLTPAALGGLHKEFIFSARLDNLAMCHAAITAFIQSAENSIEGSYVPLIALFDHEEVGSESAYGAAAPIVPMVLERIALAMGATRDDYHRMIANSLCISADMAHAVHPNYAERHDSHHRPVLNGGPVIKINRQQRYATSAYTEAIFTELCREENIPVQYYSHRNDMPCGSTIGPITSTLTGIPTVDIGNPMLSMHSAREMAGLHDVSMMNRVLTRFLSVP